MTKKYIFLTALCLAGIVFLNLTIAPAQVSTEKNFALNLNPEKIISFEQGAVMRVIFLLILLFAYLALIMAGIINFIIFLIRKLDNKPAIALQEQKKILPLSASDASRLFFLVILLYFLLYVAQLYAIQFKTFQNPLGLAISANLILEITVIVTVLKFLNKDWLGFKFNTAYFSALWRIYAAITPLIIVTSLLGNWLLEKYGVNPSLNPAIALLIQLKDPWLIIILSLQVAIVGPLAEELLFRGFIYKLARKKYSLFIATCITSAVFALLHNVPKDIVPIFILSLGLCYLYEKTQNIIAPMILHAIHNGIALIFLLTVKDLL